MLCAPITLNPVCNPLPACNLLCDRRLYFSFYDDPGVYWFVLGSADRLYNTTIHGVYVLRGEQLIHMSFRLLDSDHLNNINNNFNLKSLLIET